MGVFPKVDRIQAPRYILLEKETLYSLTPKPGIYSWPADGSTRKRCQKPQSRRRRTDHTVWRAGMPTERRMLIDKIVALVHVTLLPNRILKSLSKMWNQRRNISTCSVRPFNPLELTLLIQTHSNECRNFGAQSSTGLRFCKKIA